MTGHPPRSILITGASSGIGEALALEYAAPGVFLALSGRDPERTEAVGRACQAKGATVDARALDVTDRDTMGAWIAEIDATHPLDLVVANAGISGGTGGAGEGEEQMRRIYATNIDGVLNTVWPALTPLRTRGQGQIAVMSSIAGYRGLPHSPAYSSSKAAVKTWGEALRGWLGPEGIQVSVVCPGYVTSRMTAVNDFPMPFLMSSAKAARIIRRGLARNRSRITFPWPMALVAWLLGTLPPGMTDGVLSRLPRKEGGG